MGKVAAYIASRTFDFATSATFGIRIYKIRIVSLDRPFSTNAAVFKSFIQSYFIFSGARFILPTFWILAGAAIIISVTGVRKIFRESQLTIPAYICIRSHISFFAFYFARSKDYSVSVGRIGKLECDFIMRNQESQYSYVQVAMTIMSSLDTENREYKPLESIRDNYPKYVMTRNDIVQNRNGIIHTNIGGFIKEHKKFT